MIMLISARYDQVHDMIQPLAVAELCSEPGTIDKRRVQCTAGHLCAGQTTWASIL